MLFASWIKHPFDVPVQRLHDADPSEHRWPAEIGDQDQRFHSRLPFRRLVLGLGQLRDVIAGVHQGDQLVSVRQQYGFVETPLPSFVGLQ